jgi:hypothetical protein
MSRFFRTFACGSLAASLAMLIAFAAFAEPVAVIAAVKGKVEVTPAKAKSPVRAAFGRALEHGDKVSVASGGSATVFFNDGNVIELAEKSAITIGGRAAKGSGAIPTDVYARVSSYVTAGSRQTGLVTMASMRGPDESAPLILSPRKTSILADDPFLSWRYVPGAVRYRVRVSTSDGKELWTREMNAPTGPTTVGTDVSFPYPADVAKLKGDTDVEWEVQALDANGVIRRESTIVRVLSPSAREEVRTNLASIVSGVGGDTAAGHFLAGSYLAGLDIYEDALDQFRLLVDLDPKAPGPHETLGNAYYQVGLVDLAAAEFQQALTLQRNAR